MKKLFTLLAFAGVLFFAGMQSAQAQNNQNAIENQLRAQARQIFVQQCNSNYTGPIEVRLSGLRIACPINSNGTAYIASIVPKINCNVVDCNVILIPLLASIRFDCFGDAVDIQCNF